VQNCKQLTSSAPGGYSLQKYNLPILGKSLQLHNSPVDCAREFQSLKRLSESSSLQWKKFYDLVYGFFCGWRHKWGRFRPFWLILSGPGPNHKRDKRANILPQVFTGN